MFNNLSNTVTRALNKSIYIVKDHAPEILAVVGSVASVGAVVCAIKETPKATKIMEEHKQNIENIHTVVKSADETEEYEYTSDDEKKDLFVTYAKTGMKLAKNYWPMLVLEGISIGCTLTGAYKGRQRYSSLLSTALTMEAIHKKYRENVIERFGEETDKEMRHGIKTKAEEYVIKDKDGKETKVKEVKKSKYDTHDDITRLFDEVNAASTYSRDAYANRSFILGVEQWANHRLVTRGFVYLNEVYEKLGLPESSAGHHLGWVYKDHSKDDLAKHHNRILISFVGYDGKPAKDFENGIEPSVLLDFNVDGYIDNQIKWRRR